MNFQLLEPIRERLQNSKSSRYSRIDVGDAIHRGISELYHSEICTDFEIVVGDKCFRCHKVVLASVSDYFRAMFTSGMTETVQNKTKFDDVCPTVFDTIFAFLYPDEEIDDPLADRSEEEMTELLRVSEMLQMKILSEKCCGFFKSTMSTENCIERWKMAKSILNDEISQVAWTFLLQNFQQFVSEQMLISLDFDDFLAVIEDDSLVVEEEHVWRAIRDWIKFDEPNRQNRFENLIQECSLTEIPEDILFEEIAFDPLVRQNDAASKLVQEAIQFIRHPSLHASITLKLRRRVNKEQVLALIGKKKDGDGISTLKTSSVVRAFTMSYETGRVTHVQQLLDVKEGLAVCVLGSSVFVASGSAMYECTLTDHGCGWKKCEPIIVPVRKHTMSATDDGIYVVGEISGSSTNSRVLKYSLKDNEWTVVGEILVPVCNASSVCLRNKIYIFGGTMSQYQPINSVQEYDIKTGTATILCNLPNPCRFSRALARGSDVYIVTSDGEVLHFSTISQKIDPIATFPSFKRVDYGIDMQKKVLSVYGGQVLQDNSDDEDYGDDHTEEYSTDIVSVDVVSGALVESKQLPFPLQVFGSGRMIKSKE